MFILITREQTYHKLSDIYINLDKVVALEIRNDMLILNLTDNSKFTLCKDTKEFITEAIRKYNKLKNM